jgi:tetratricopeptide (TPR) repeat protein
MYGEMARAIAEKAQIDLTADELTRLTSARQVNPESYDAYLKGLSHANKGTPEALKIALQYFDLALEIDPNNALAHVGISRVWTIRYHFNMTPRQEAMPLIKTPLDKALELDNTLAEAHSMLADYRWRTEWDWESAEKEIQQALRLNPNLSGAHASYSHILCIMGRIEEALQHIELALDLDPQNPTLLNLYAFVLGYHCRWDDAIAAFRTELDIEPSHTFALGGLAVALGAKGMYDEALAIWRKVYADDAELTKALEDSFEKAGYKGAYRALADLMAEGYVKTDRSVDTTEIARNYLDAGDYDLAIDWLEKAYEEHAPMLPYIGVPLWDPLRSNPRFQDLLRKMNLPADEKE